MYRPLVDTSAPPGTNGTGRGDHVMSPRVAGEQASGRDAHRLRGRRVRVHDLHLGPIRAAAVHPGLGSFDAVVDDLSLYGLALVIQDAASRAQLILGGDRFERLRVTYAGGDLYQGGAIVRHIAERHANLVIGVELDSGGIDFSEIYRRGARSSFAERWTEAEAEAGEPHIAPAFRAWVADLRTYLEGVRTYLLAEERAIGGEDKLSRDQLLDQYLEELAPRLVARIFEANRELGSLVAHLPDDQHARYRAFCRSQLGELFKQAPFMRRAFEKPLGYAGDYEMMNMLYRPHGEGDTLFARALNMYATQEAAAKANINRIGYLGDKIRAAVATSTRERVRIASIGCGPAREIAALLEASPALGVRLDVALIDQEER